MKQFVAGIVVAVVVIIVVPLVYLGVGGFDVAATTAPGFFERTIAPWARDASIEERAPDGPNPFANAANAVDVGFDHYRENCVICHAAPGVKAGELAKGLNPKAPHLWDTDVQQTPDGETFWVIKHGVRMTGMPAFGPTHSDEDIWKIVTFIHHLNSLTPQQVAALRQVTAEEKPGHDEATDAKADTDAGAATAAPHSAAGTKAGNGAKPPAHP